MISTLDPTPERAFLASVLVDSARACEVADTVRPEHLADDKLRTVYSIVLDLTREGSPADPMAVAARLGPPALAAVGGYSFLMGLAAEVTSSAHLTHYAGLVRDAATSRALVSKLAPVLSDAKAEPHRGSEHLEAAAAAVYAIGGEARSKRAQVTSADLPKMLEFFGREDRRHVGIDTGIFDLDALLGGLEAGALIVAGARPSVGKSSLGFTIAHEVAVKRQEPVAIFSLEMGRDSVWHRLLSIHTGISLQKIRQNHLDRDERERVKQAAYEVGRAPLLIDDLEGQTTLGMRGSLRRFAHKYGLALTFVDYLQLVEPPERSKSRVEDVGAISRGLKLLAREFNIPVLAAAQLNRAADEKSEPLLSHLRESGSIESDADVVIFIHRPGIRDIDEDKKTECYLICAKHRNGPTGTVKVHFQTKSARVCNLMPQVEDWSADRG